MITQFGPRIRYAEASNAAGSEPFINFPGFANANDETLIVKAQEGRQRIDVDLASGFVAVDDDPVGAGTSGQDGRIAFAVDAVGPGFPIGKPEAVEVHGLQGADTFHVTPGTIPVLIDGGDPIGSGDTLTVNANTSAVFMPGPENDEGSFTVDTQQPISFEIGRAHV